jgi:hypothetical protein
LRHISARYGCAVVDEALAPPATPAEEPYGFIRALSDK